MTSVRGRLRNGTLAGARQTLLLCLAASCLIPAAGAKAFQLPSHTNRRNWIVSDVNGDRLADLAAAGPGRRDGSGYAREISVNLAGAGKSQFTVRTTGASIQLCLRDVDGDHDRDLIIVEPWSRRAIGVWLNDGLGHFEEGNLTKYSAALGQPPPQSAGAAPGIVIHLLARSQERTPEVAPVVSGRELRAFSAGLILTDHSNVFSASRTVSSPRAPPSLG